MIRGHIGYRLDQYVKQNKTCLEDCNSSTSNCKDVGCSSKLDINGNPYLCLSEEEALIWHKKCLPSSEKYCQYTGRYFVSKCYVQSVLHNLYFELLNHTNKLFS